MEITKENIIKLIKERCPSFNCNNEKFIDDAYIFFKNKNKLCPWYIKKYLIAWRKSKNLLGKQCQTLEHWLSNGYDLEEAKIKLNEHKKLKHQKHALKYGYIFNNINDFVVFMKKYFIFENFNFDNFELIKEIYEYIGNDYISKKDIKNKIYEFLNIKREGKKVSTSSKLYWMTMGWNETDAIEKVSNFQKSLSVWCEDFWVKHRNLSKEEAKIEISKTQNRNNNKFLNKYTAEERSLNSVWNKHFWINKKGYTEEEAKLQLRKMNPSCIEYYNYDYDKYNELKKRISNDVKNAWQNGAYDKNNYINSRKQSKEEILFFEFLTLLDNNIIHKPYSINVKDKNNILHKAIYDGYYKYDNLIILLEYDGAYYHKNNQKRDLERDKKTLKLRKDISGIIRIECKYFKNNKNNIINKIYESIEKIKNSKEKRIKLYT